MEPREIVATLRDGFDESRSNHSHANGDPDMKRHQKQTAETNEAVAAFVDAGKVREAIDDLVNRIV